MKITHIDGSETETEKIASDLVALALEKTKEYLDALSQYKIPCFVRFAVDGKTFSGAHSFLDGNRDPREVKLELFQDSLECWTKHYPGCKIVVMSDAAYEKVKEVMGNQEETE